MIRYALVLGVLFAFIYLPDVGHGFVKDDVGWIARTELRSLEDARGLLAAPTGFFRPMVSLSFGVNRWVCGLNARCFGTTNLLLAIACAAAIFLLAAALSLPREAALAAAAIWLFNWHGINMAVLWISGRTALIVVLFAALAAAAFVKERFALAAALSFAAMLAKEEAILVPASLMAWFAIEQQHRPRRLLAMAPFVAASVVAGAAYFFMRARSGAFTPLTAPPFYRLDFSLDRVLSNAPAYLDRTATFAAVVVLMWLAIRRPALRELRQSSARVASFSICWWLTTLGITLFLPVRSSLYACLPSVGVALLAASIFAATWPSTNPRRRAMGAIASLVLAMAMWPVYHARNRPSVLEADLSTTTIGALRRVAGERGEGTVIVLRDDRSARPSLENSFGTMIQDAADLLVVPRVSVWIDPPPSDATLAGLKPPPRAEVVLQLQNGALRQIQ